MSSKSEESPSREGGKCLALHTLLKAFVCQPPDKDGDGEGQAAVEQSRVAPLGASSLVFVKSPHKTIPLGEGTEGEPFFARQKLTALRGIKEGASPVSSPNQPAEVNPSKVRTWLLCAKVKLIHLS